MGDILVQDQDQKAGAGAGPTGAVGPLRGQAPLQVGGRQQVVGSHPAASIQQPTGAGGREVVAGGDQALWGGGVRHTCTHTHTHSVYSHAAVHRCAAG